MTVHDLTAARAAECIVVRDGMRRVRELWAAGMKPEQLRDSIIGLAERARRCGDDETADLATQLIALTERVIEPLGPRSGTAYRKDTP